MLGFSWNMRDQEAGARAGFCAQGRLDLAGQAVMGEAVMMGRTRESGVSFAPGPPHLQEHRLDGRHVEDGGPL